MLNKYKKKYQTKALEERINEIYKLSKKKNYKHQDKHKWSKFWTEGNKTRIK